MKKTARPVKKTSSLLTGIVTCILAFSTGLYGEAAAASSDTHLKSVPEINTTASYIYNPAGKPDPFQPFIERETIKKKKLEKLQKLQTLQTFSILPLQRISIDQFRLVGIAGDAKRMIAIVEDPKGKFYPLFQGTYIGQNNGMVVKIFADRIIVEEKVKTSTGKTQVKRIPIRLQKEEDEVKL